MINADEARPLVSEMLDIVRAFQSARHRNQSRGIVSTKVRALKLLRTGDRRTTELADHLAISLPVASRTVAALEEDGFVIRRPDPTDARASLLSITDAGRERAAARDDQITQLFADSMKDWDPERAAKAAEVLRDLHEHVISVIDALAETTEPTPIARRDRA